ncbi:hypothetical protein ACJMK2_033612, partial [Sinanodonta woodiana]
TFFSDHSPTISKVIWTWCIDKKVCSFLWIDGSFLVFNSANVCMRENLQVASHGSVLSGVFPGYSSTINTEYTNPNFQISITVDFRLNTSASQCRESHDSQIGEGSNTIHKQYPLICGMQWTLTNFTSVTNGSK